MKTLKQKKPSLQATHQIRVRFNEVDSLGIVWHGNYIKYFEDGREAFGREFAMTYLDVKSHGFATPIVKMSSEHQLPLRYGELATVEVTYVNSRAAKLMFSYRLKNEAGETVCTGETTQVFTAFKTGVMSLNLPAFFKSWKEKHDLLHD